MTYIQFIFTVVAFIYRKGGGGWDKEEKDQRERERKKEEKIERKTLKYDRVSISNMFPRYHMRIFKCKDV
jgi:hypothetical protein